MALQYSITTRNNQLDQVEVTAGATAKLRLYTGAPPADCATAASGTLLVEMTLPADYFSNAAAGAKAKLGTWSGTASAGSGATPGYFRLVDNAGTTTIAQGTVALTLAAIATNALTAANGNVLNFAATTGVTVGMDISGTGVPTGATVVAVTGTTVTMSMTSTAGVANATAITFSGDMTVDGTITSGQTVTVNTFTINAANA